MGLEFGFPDAIGGPAGGLAIILVALLSIAWQVALTALGGVVAWRWLHRPGGLADASRSRAKNAFEIIAERYARGEIDAAEFEERRARLRCDETP